MIDIPKGYTPGPWYVHNVGWIGSSKGTICAMYAMTTGSEDKEGDANARLIASAPAMVDEITSLTAENERLRAAIKDARTLIWEARLFKGYIDGPLHQPFAEMVEKELTFLGWPPRAALSPSQEKSVEPDEPRYWTPGGVMKP